MMYMCYVGLWDVCVFITSGCGCFGVADKLCIACPVDPFVPSQVIVKCTFNHSNQVNKTIINPGTLGVWPQF